MVSSEINQVVEKLAEKIGVAITKVQPLADEIVRQYVLRHTLFAISTGLMIGISIVLAIYFGRKYKTMDHKFGSEGDINITLTFIFWFVAFLFSWLCICEIASVLSPLIGLLGL